MIEEIAEKLNNAELSINLLYEKWSSILIYFPEILIIKSHNILTFKVYRRPTNKNDDIYFYSHHNKIKTGLLIQHLEYASTIQSRRIWVHRNSLKSLNYFIFNARKKALKMHLSNKL